MGTVVISLDSELAWGFHDKNNPPQYRIKNARDGWRQLINLFESYDIPATWAIVGHLFLDECDGEHSNHPSPTGWFNRDPGGTVDENPDWFGTDLIIKLLESEVNHEIGYHSFSHVEFGAEGTTSGIASTELAECQQVTSDWNCDPDSFVFPRNNVGHLDLLSDYGFTCYRGKQPPDNNDSLLPPTIQRLSRLVLGQTSPPIVNPYVTDNDVVNIPASFYLYTFENKQNTILKSAVQMASQLVFKCLPFDPHLRQVKLGLKAVSDEPNSVFHIWLHPNNIVTVEDTNRIESVLEEVSRYRDNQDLAVKTMGEVAGEVLSSHE